MITAYAILCTTVFSATLNVIYFSKKHIKSKETETFSILLFINLLGLIVEFLCSYIGNNFITDSSPARLFTRIYLGYLMLYLLYMTLYIYVVCYASDKNMNLNYYKKLEKISYIIYISCLIIDLFLPLQTSAGYATGKAVDFVYICSSICIGIWFIPIIKNRKKINFKKFIPLFCYVLLIGIIALIQKMNPHITLVTIMEFLIIFIMYHTIENPDTKVLEEVHKAKEISDNANEEKAMFLYNMTNEIRKVTKEIDNASDGILKEIDNKKIDSNLIGDYTRDIKNSTAKFTAMTNEMLDISQIDSANIRIYNDKYNIKLIIKELVQKYKDACLKKNLDFRTSIASDIPDYLYGDSVSLKKALTIILDNSVKYTSDGYVEFSVNTIMRRDVCRLIISIEDSGRGIKANDLAKVFSKKEEDTEEDRHNLDNNLYNAKRLITLMGGTIIPSSVYDKGTTIKVVLDQKVASTDTNGLNKYEELYDEKKILLVDDNESSTKIISKMLGGTNIKLDTVSLGSECLAKIRNKEKYDLILLDEDMKPLDGITVMKKLQSIRSFNTKVILLTHNNDYEYNDDYQKYGFSDYILKPIAKDKLLEKIDKCLK